MSDTTDDDAFGPDDFGGSDYPDHDEEPDQYKRRVEDALLYGDDDHDEPDDELPEPHPKVTPFVERRGAAPVAGSSALAPAKPYAGPPRWVCTGCSAVWHKNPGPTHEHGGVTWAVKPMR